jgi:hypothetical protein
MISAPPTTHSPFVGPVPFSSEDPLYGREQELPRLFDLLVAQRIVLFYSPSGAGKTSLIEAKNGLRSLLVSDGFTVWPTIRVNRLPETTLADRVASGNRYVYSLLHSLEAGYDDAERIPDIDLVEMDLPTYLSRRAASEDNQLDVLILDQFEELMTADPADRAKKLAFLGQLGEALRARNRWALFSMREDYVAGLDPYLRLIPTQLGTTYRLDLLDPGAAQRAIHQPAANSGVEFASDAAPELVRNLRMIRVQRPDGTAESREGDWVEPVYLQIVCQGLWQDLVVTRQVRRIELADVGQPDAPAGSETGDIVDLKLRGYYEDALRLKLEDEAVHAAGIDEITLRTWFDTDLITEQDVRPQLLLGEGRVGNLPVAAVWPLVEKRLVRKEDRRGLIWFELAHDRLIRPIRQSNSAWFRDHPSPLQTLRQQAMLWSQRGEPDDLLLPRSALDDARKIETEQAAHLLPIERTYLERSRLDAERQRARARRFKFGAALLATVVLLIVIGAILARRAEQRAQHERNRSQVFALVAETQRQRLGGEDERAALLAREAFSFARDKADVDERETASALRLALGGPRLALVFRDHGAEVLAVTFPDVGNELVSVDRDGLVQRRSLNPQLPTGSTKLCAPRGGQEDPCAGAEVALATFSRTGRLVALGLETGGVLVSDLNEPDPLPIRQVCQSKADVRAIAFSADERTLAVAYSSGLVYTALLGKEDAPCERLVAFAPEGGESVKALAFDPIQGTLAIGTTRRLVWVEWWPPPSRLGRTARHRSHEISLARR